MSGAGPSGECFSNRTMVTTLTISSTAPLRRGVARRGAYSAADRVMGPSARRCSIAPNAATMSVPTA